MLVRDRMNPNVKTLDDRATIKEALDLLLGSDFDAAPVVRGDQIVGVVSQWDLLKAAVGRSEQELLALSLASVMSRKVVTVPEDEILEEAAYLMEKHDIGSLPVLDDHGHVVGIITQDDFFRIFVEMLGLTEPGTRITLGVEDRVGVLEDLTDLVRAANVNIISVATFNALDPKRARVVIRLATQDAHDIVERLKQKNYRVLHVSQVWE